MTEPERVLRPLFDWRSAVASAHGPESSTTRLVLLTLALHMSAKGDSCFPSIETLARESALSKKAVISHLAIAEEQGWISKAERPQRNGQGWRRMEYFSSTPPGIHAKVTGQEGGERRSPPLPVDNFQGGERHAEGGERQGKKVVNDVHLSTSVNSSKSSTRRAAPRAPRSLLDRNHAAGEEWLRKGSNDADQ